MAFSHIQLAGEAGVSAGRRSHKVLPVQNTWAGSRQEETGHSEKKRNVNLVHVISHFLTTGTVGGPTHKIGRQINGNVRSKITEESVRL